MVVKRIDVLSNAQQVGGFMERMYPCLCTTNRYGTRSNSIPKSGHQQGQEVRLLLMFLLTAGDPSHQGCGVEILTIVTI